MAIIGYARVSTTDQNPQLQLAALQEAGATRVFTDHGVSGSKASRPELDACLDHLRKGDVLTVWKLDRLGRNTQHVLAVIDQLMSSGVGFRSLTEGLHTEGPMGRAMLTIMAADDRGVGHGVGAAGHGQAVPQVLAPSGTTQPIPGMRPRREGER